MLESLSDFPLYLFDIIFSFLLHGTIFYNFVKFLAESALIQKLVDRLDNSFGVGFIYVEDFLFISALL